MRIIFVLLWAVKLVVGGAPETGFPDNPPILSEDMRDRLLEYWTVLRGEEASGGEDLALWMEEITSLSLNLNTASRSSLEALNLLSAYQVAALLDYRSKYGLLFSWKELELIPGFSPQIREFLQIFCKLEQEEPSWRGRDSSFLSSVRQESLMRMKMNFPVKEEEQKYLGPLIGRMLRCRASAAGGRAMAGFCIESDAGEVSWADHLSVYVQVKNLKRINKAVLGDYKLCWGQGLVVWNGLSMSSSADMTGFKVYGAGISAYGGASEASSLRGGAAEIGISNNWILSASLSYNKEDARIRENGFTSLPEGGYHRTVSEADVRNNLGVYTAGLQIKREAEHWRISAHGFAYGYDHNDDRALKAYHHSQFRGRAFGAAALAWTVYLGRWNAYGEAAVDALGRGAAVAGVFHQSSDDFSWALEAHSFHKDYTAPYACYSGGGSINNQSGLRLGASYGFHQKWKAGLKAGLNYYQGARYRCDSPSAMCDALLRLDYSSLKTQSYLQLRWQRKSENDTFGSFKESFVNAFNKVNLRLHAGFGPYSGFLLDSRVEGIIVHPALGYNEYGILAYQEAKFRNVDESWVISARLEGYWTSSWESRLYAYETDMLYGFSVPALYGRGLRTYINIRRRLFKNLDLYLRWSYGPRHEAKLQLRWKM